MVVDAAQRVSEINILTVTRRGHRWRRQRRHLRRARYRAWIVHNLAGQSTALARLKQFDFLHSATWVDVDRFPTGYGNPAESKHWHWMLFCSNFNQQRESYLEGFLDAFAEGVGAFWRGSTGFPSFPGPGTRYELHQWLDTRLMQSELYYAAYGGATAHDVREALRLAREHCTIAPGAPEARWAADRAECFATVRGRIRWNARRLGGADGQQQPGVAGADPAGPGGGRACAIELAGAGVLRQGAGRRTSPGSR